MYSNFMHDPGSFYSYTEMLVIVQIRALKGSLTINFMVLSLSLLKSGIIIIIIIIITKVYV